MPKKRIAKKNIYLETSFEDILVCKKNSLKPFMEVFIQKPENITQQNLGTLAGIFEITNHSENSSYIVNYLVSIIKKEYYAKNKRGALESFESALHKANLALAKLAEHGSVEWIGKLNAVILVIEKNNLHLSQTGKVKSFLLRDQALIDLDEGVSNPKINNPLKTFTDVTSGRLKDQDKFIMTTNSIFDILPTEELRKNALSFSSLQFIQFLKTALINELERAAVLVLETQKVIRETPPVIKKPAQFNAFSQTTFKQPASIQRSSPQPNPNTPKRDPLFQEIEKALEKKNGDFIDKKTGHIYIKGNYPLDRSENSLIGEQWETIKNKAIDFNSSFSEFFKPNLKKVDLKRLSTKLTAFFSTNQLNSSIKKTFTPLNLRKKITQTSSSWRNVKLNSLVATLKNKNSLQLKYLRRKNNSFSLLTQKFLAKNKPLLSTFFKTLFQKIGQVSSSIFPRFFRIKKIFAQLNFSQRIYAFLALILLLVIPYFIVRKGNQPTSSIQSLKKATLKNSYPLSQDKKVKLITQINSLYTAHQTITNLINLNGTIFAIEKNQLVDIENKKVFSIPNNFSELKLSTGMNDLNLIFLLTKKNILLSWSPVSKKFQTNTLNLPANSQLSFIKTYLTYLYALDKNNNQIYRFPRTEGGFGTKINWLKTTLKLNTTSSLAVSDYIFLVNSHHLIQLNQGRKQTFNLEKTATPIRIDTIYTKRKDKNIYLLDKTNTRIVKVDFTGNIIAQFYNTNLSQAKNLVVDEKNSLVYFLNKNSIKSFKMK